MGSPAQWTPVDESAWKPVAEDPKTPADKGFFQTLASDVMGAPKKFMDWATSEHPVDSALDTIREFTAARKAQQDKAVAAYHAGDYKAAAEHALFSVPFVGPMAAAAADETQNGQPGQGYAHMAELAAPLIGPVTGAIGEALPETIAGAVEGTGEVIKGVAKNPAARSIAAGGAQVAGSPVALMAGHPIVAGSMALRGAGNLYKGLQALGGAEEAAAVAPELEAAAQRIAGQPYAALDANSQAMVQQIIQAEKNVASQTPPTARAPLTAAPTAAPAAPGMTPAERLAAEFPSHPEASAPAPIVVHKANIPPRAGGVNVPLRPPLATAAPTTPVEIPSTPVEAAAEPPVSRETPELPTKEPLSHQEIAAALRAEMEKSGTLEPETPVKPGPTTEAYIGAARGTRADKAATLGATMAQIGAEPGEIPSMLQEVADAHQINLPKTKVALDKLIRDVTTEALKIKSQSTGIGGIMRNQ